MQLQEVHTHVEREAREYRLTVRIRGEGILHPVSIALSLIGSLKRIFTQENIDFSDLKDAITVDMTKSEEKRPIFSQETGEA